MGTLQICCMLTKLLSDWKRSMQQSMKFVLGIISPHPDTFYKPNVKITNPHWNFTCPRWLLPAFGRWAGVNVVDCAMIPFPKLGDWESWKFMVFPHAAYANLGLYSLRRRLISIGIPIINLRRSLDLLRFIMGIPIPVRRRLLSE